MSRWIAVASLALLAITPRTWAHSDAYFDQKTAPHGGQVRMAGPYHIELVMGDDQVSIFLTDHSEQPVDATGGSGKAIVTTGKKKRYTIVLEYAQGNMLKGSGTYTANANSTVTVLVKLPEQEPQHAQFKPIKTSHKTTKHKRKAH